MASRVVVPETTIMHISNGDWLLVKKRLNHGEQTDAFARRYVASSSGVHVDLNKVGMDRVTAYLLDWSLVGLDGKQIVIQGQPVSVVESALNLLDEDSFSEIKSAVETHEAAMEQERLDAKKILDGATGSPVISPSLVGAAGDTSGSES